MSTLAGFFAAASSGFVLWKLSFSLRKEQAIFWQQLFYHITCSKLSLISVVGKPVSLKPYPFFITAINSPSTAWSLPDEVVTLHFNRWYKLSSGSETFSTSHRPRINFCMQDGYCKKTEGIIHFLNKSLSSERTKRKQYRTKWRGITV